MPAATIEIITIVFYLTAFLMQAIRVWGGSSTTDQQSTQTSLARYAQPLTMVFAGLAITGHFLTSWGQLVSHQGIDFSLIPVSVVILLAINLIVVIGSFRQPLHSLFLLLFPATAMLILVSLIFGGDSSSVKMLTPSSSVHILFSIIAYSLMTIAALEALFLAYQNRQLHLHHNRGLQILPPLQTMETLLFSIVAAGFVSLTIAIATGLAFVDNFMAQHLAHKTFFSGVSWVVYAILLWGRFRLGWRGKTASKWTLWGFFALMLAYLGSKFVLEVLLSP